MIAFKRGIQKCFPGSTKCRIQGIGRLVYQSLILIATVGSAAPAWYIHAFLPVLWPLIGWGIAGATRSRVSRWLLAAQIVYAPLFLVCAAVADLLFYAGCPFKQGESHFLDVTSVGALLARPSLLLQHLRILSFPASGIGFFAAGLLSLALGAALTLHCLWRAEPRNEWKGIANGLATRGGFSP